MGRCRSAASDAARGRRIRAIRSIGLRARRPRLRAQSQLLALRRLSRHRRRRARQKSPMPQSGAIRAAEVASCRAAISNAPRTRDAFGRAMRRSRRADLPFEFMMNALRLNDGVADRSISSQRTGLRASAITDQARVRSRCAAGSNPILSYCVRPKADGGFSMIWSDLFCRTLERRHMIESISIALSVLRREFRDQRRSFGRVTIVCRGLRGVLPTDRSAPSRWRRWRADRVDFATDNDA